MTFVVFSNLVLMLLCVAVIVQSLRMAKSFRSFRSCALNDSVAQLDRATGQAKAVLAELRTLLANDGAAQARAIASGEALRDELSVIVGIGNSIAERIVEAAATHTSQKDEQGAAAVTTVSSIRPAGRKPRVRGGGARRKAAAAVVEAQSMTVSA
jgi:predicted flap endonuclease-1-like 5' DNA nuclease